MDQQEQIGRLITEIKRSILYFRQTFPTAQFDQILFSGDSDILGALKSQAQEELGINSNILNFEAHVDRSAFRGEWDEFRFHLPALAAALGAAWRRTEGTGINLLPGKTLPQREGWTFERVAKVGASLSLAVALASGLYYLNQRPELQAERRQLQQKISVLEPQLRQAEAWSTRRQMAAFLERINSRKDWIEVFRGLTFVVPKTAVFETLRIESIPKPVLFLSGHLLAPTAVQANADFNRFFSDLRGLPFIERVAMNRPLSIAYEDTAASATATPVALAAQSRVSFEVGCELK